MPLVILGHQKVALKKFEHSQHFCNSIFLGVEVITQ